MMRGSIERRGFPEQEERQREFEKMIRSREREVIPPELAEYAATVTQEFEGLKPKKEDFAGSKKFTASEIKGDFLETKRNAEARNEDIAEKEIPTFAEAVLALASVEGDWLGKDATVVAATQYDDHRGVDYVYELKRPDGGVVRFAVDVTTAEFPRQGPRPDETVRKKETAVDTMRKKVGALLRRSREGELPSQLKYFASEAKPGTTGRIGLPKAILAFRPKEIFELADVHQRTRENRNDEEAKRLLREHPLRREFLAQIELALRASEATLAVSSPQRRIERGRTARKGKARRSPEETAKEALSRTKTAREAVEAFGPIGKVRNATLRDAYAHVIEGIVRRRR